MAKYAFKLYMHGSDRTVVIKIPLVRNVMPKRQLAAFFRGRDERRTSRRSELLSRRSARGSSSAGELTERMGRSQTVATVVPHQAVDGAMSLRVYKRGAPWYSTGVAVFGHKE